MTVVFCLNQNKIKNLLPLKILKNPNKINVLLT